MALLPELSPAEAYEVLLQRIGTIAPELMEKPLEEINHKMVVRLARVLLAARREKHMATRVWVELASRELDGAECLRHWRREMKKKAHPSYLPIWKETKAASIPCSSVRRMAKPQNADCDAHGVARPAAGHIQFPPFSTA